MKFPIGEAGDDQETQPQSLLINLLFFITFFGTVGLGSYIVSKAFADSDYATTGALRAAIAFLTFGLVLLVYWKFFYTPDFWGDEASPAATAGVVLGAVIVSGLVICLAIEHLNGKWDVSRHRLALPIVELRERQDYKGRVYRRLIVIDESRPLGAAQYILG